MRACIALATLFLGLVLSQPISAAECIPQDQLTEEDKYAGRLKDKCVKSIEVKGSYKVAELLDGTIAYYSYGNTDAIGYDRTSRVEDPQVPDQPHTTKEIHIIELLANANTYEPANLENLVRIFNAVLQGMEKREHFSYELSDAIFSKIWEVVEKIDLENSLYILDHYIVNFLTAARYSRRYAHRLNQFMEELKETITISGLVDIYNRGFVQYALDYPETIPASEKLTQEEAQQFLKILLAYREKEYLRDQAIGVTSAIRSDELRVIKRHAPDLFQEIVLTQHSDNIDNVLSRFTK